MGHRRFRVNLQEVREDWLTLLTRTTRSVATTAAGGKLVAFTARAEREWTILTDQLADTADALDAPHGMCPTPPPTVRCS
jgi:hypothetical protein